MDRPRAELTATLVDSIKLAAVYDRPRAVLAYLRAVAYVNTHNTGGLFPNRYALDAVSATRCREDKCHECDLCSLVAEGLVETISYEVSVARDPITGLRIGQREGEA